IHFCNIIKHSFLMVAKCMHGVQRIMTMNLHFDSSVFAIPDQLTLVDQ
ncbi:hypothetical protein CISIN_1g0157542mg, partial [Citrus sinensis]